MCANGASSRSLPNRSDFHRCHTAADKHTQTSFPFSLLFSDSLSFCIPSFGLHINFGTGRRSKRGLSGYLLACSTRTFLFPLFPHSHCVTFSLSLGNAAPRCDLNRWRLLWQRWVTYIVTYIHSRTSMNFHINTECLSSPFFPFKIAVILFFNVNEWNEYRCNLFSTKNSCIDDRFISVQFPTLDLKLEERNFEWE